MEKTDREKSLEAVIKERPLVQGDEKILVLGASGQVAGYLVPRLKKYYGDSLILTDVRENKEENIQALDVTKAAAIEDMVKKNNVKVIINLAALLSGAAAEKPDLAKLVNIEAPKAIFHIAKEHGVRKVFTPSSIAVMGPDADVNDKGKTTIDTKCNPISNYGQAKEIIEKMAADYNKTTDVQGLCLRYGGVLACHVPPSDGTTEELDRMIVAAAEFVAKRGQNLKYSEHGIYHPQIPGDLLFPMIDGTSVGTETMRYLHADPKDIKGKETQYHLAEYYGGLDEVNNLIQNALIPDDLKGGFKVVYDESKYNQNKVSFAESWPKKLDMDPAKNDWGFQHGLSFAQSVEAHFERLVEQFREQSKPKVQPSEHEESARRGILPSNGHASHTSKPGAAVFRG